MPVSVAAAAAVSEFGDPASTFATLLVAQIIHRDVKALNVLLKELNGYLEVCICDFGAKTWAKAC